MTDRFAEQRAKLKDEIPAYADRTGPPCKQVSITLRYPVYSDLTQDQMEFYLGWRASLGTDGFTRAADGYAWLLVSELLNTDPSRIAGMCTAVAADGSPLYPGLLGTVLDCSRVFGTPLPSFSPWMAAVPECGFVSRAFSSPVSDLPPEAMTGYVPDVSLRITDKIRFARLSGTVLREYDALLRERTGKGLRQTFLRPVKGCHLPFSDYAYTGRKTPVETVTWEPRDDSLKALFNLLCDLFSGRSLPGVYRVPLREELISLFASISVSGIFTDSPDPFSKPDGVRSRTFGSPHTALGASRLNDPSARTDGTRMTLGDVLTFSELHRDGSSVFVTCDYDHPSYSDLSKASFDYYIYWRDSFLSGRALDTDNGYVNLLLTELINTDRGEETSKILSRLLEAYGNDEGSLIGVTLADHAICNGVPFTDYRVLMDRYVVNSWVESFVHCNNATPLDAVLLNMMRSGSLSVRFIGRQFPVEVMGRALRRIFGSLLSKDPVKVFSPESVTVTRGLYFGLQYFRGTPERRVTYRNYLGNRKFTHFVDKACNYAVTLMDIYAEGKGRKRPVFSFSGIDCASILDEEFSVWWALRNRPREKELRLDGDAIAAAESDLSSVTEMMRVEDPDEAVEETTCENTGDKGDPWARFRDSLSDVEKGYIAAVLADPTSAKGYLRSNGSRLEDDINRKALDTVGDTVIEDCTPVEDYVEELRKMV